MIHELYEKILDYNLCMSGEKIAVEYAPEIRVRLLFLLESYPHHFDRVPLSMDDFSADGYYVDIQTGLMIHKEAGCLHLEELFMIPRFNLSTTQIEEACERTVQAGYNFLPAFFLTKDVTTVSDTSNVVGSRWFRKPIESVNVTMDYGEFLSTLPSKKRSDIRRSRNKLPGCSIRKIDPSDIDIERALNGLSARFSGDDEVFSKMFFLFGVSMATIYPEYTYVLEMRNEEQVLATGIFTHHKDINHVNAHSYVFSKIPYVGQAFVSYVAEYFCSDKDVYNVNVGRGTALDDEVYCDYMSCVFNQSSEVLSIAGCTEELEGIYKPFYLKDRWLLGETYEN